MADRQNIRLEITPQKKIDPGKRLREDATSFSIIVFGSFMALTALKAASQRSLDPLKPGATVVEWGLVVACVTFVAVLFQIILANRQIGLAKDELDLVSEELDYLRADF